MNTEHAEARYFVTRGPLYDRLGRPRDHHRHFVVLESRIGRCKEPLRLMAACNCAKAANAARRLLSGECAVRP